MVGEDRSAGNASDDEFQTAMRIPRVLVGSERLNLSLATSGQSHQDAVFVEEFLRHEGRDDAAAIVAYKRAGFVEPQWPMAIAAERHLKRLKPAIDAARKTFTTAIKNERSRDSILADLDDIYDSALKDKDHSAAINAKRLEAQLQGFLEDKVSVTHKMEIGQLSDEQLLRVINRKPVVDGEFTDVTPKGIGHMKPPDGQLDPGTGG